MDMSSATSSMAMSMSPTTTASGLATSTSASSMSSMSMGSGCKISMTWNWYTIDACFIAKSWRITSSGVFAGSCIGVICLVICLEFLRRLQREYDGFIRRRDQKALAASVPNQRDTSECSESHDHPDQGNNKHISIGILLRKATGDGGRPLRQSRMTLLKRQFIRAVFHMLQFAAAYFIMLLAMYYNGYIIICIIIGAFLGSFIFSWDQMLDQSKSEPADVTGCCG